MKKILVVNGVNLNMLGLREPEKYGKRTYAELVGFVKLCAKEQGVKVVCVQSNHEGEIVEIIQRARGRYDGIVLNAGAYTHTSIAILDALRAAEVPTVEVHLTDVTAREEYRKVSYVSEYAKMTICGKGFDGYKEAIAYFAKK